MSNYSEDASMVRVDFFKPSGKWCCTEAVKWTGAYRDECIYESFSRSLRDHLCGRLSGMDAVCLEPYHEFSHPLKINNGGWLK